MIKGKSLSYVFMTLVVLLAILIAVFYTLDSEPKVTNFEECVAAGYPVMESYPRQCRTPDELFIENVSVVGGEKDENGCLISAGYSWNESTQTCIRQREISERDYIEKDVEKCETIQFLCAAPKTPFYDATGCGCEPEGATQNDFKFLR